MLQGDSGSIYMEPRSGGHELMAVHFKLNFPAITLLYEAKPKKAASKYLTRQGAFNA
jgi:hypothetical protein